VGLEVASRSQSLAEREAVEAMLAGELLGGEFGCFRDDLSGFGRAYALNQSAGCFVTQWDG
jgi:hypothetical protein